jgi:cell division protein ZapE
MPETLLQRYRSLIESGRIAADPAQALAVEKLQLLANRIASYPPPARTDRFSFFTRRRGEVPRGLYLFGGVGRGKTMLMDLFFETVRYTPKRRVHFHEFMSEVHERIAQARKTHPGEAVKKTAADIAGEARLLCFDELFVVNIADAMILGRLFEALFANGAVIVATSNTHPADLYKNGLNRALFLPFIELIEANMEVLMLEAARDYRLGKLAGTPLYFTPLDATARARMDAVWAMLTGGVEPHPVTLSVKGRTLYVPRSAMGSARFDFASLFGEPLGADDYLAIARAFHTVFVDGIPVMKPEQRNEARRFITFIDTLYDSRTGFVATAEAEPGALYAEGDGADSFVRTASRLIEMRSASYLTGRKASYAPDMAEGICRGESDA